MKINKVMNAHVTAGEQRVTALTLPVARTRTPLAEEETTVTVEQHEPIESVVFPASDRFKHMLKLIARDNKELYNRIIGME